MAGAVHGRADIGADLLRRPAVHRGAGRRPGVRGRYAADLRRVHVRARPHSRGCHQPRERLQGLGGKRFRIGRDRGRRDRCRAVLRLLVVGRIRNGPELRRGVKEPQEERAAGDVHLGDWPGHLLHPDLVGAVRRLLHRQRRRAPGAGQCGELLPAARQRHRGPLGRFHPQLPDHYRVVRLWHGLPQHGGQVRILTGARRTAPAPARPDASPLQEPPHRVDRPVRDRGADRDRVRRVHRVQRSEQPGLPPAVRPDGGDGRDHHPGRAGDGLAVDLHLLRAPPQPVRALVEDQAGARPLLHLAGLRRVPAVRQHQFPRLRVRLCQMARADRRAGRARRHRLRLLPEVTEQGEIRVGQASSTRGFSAWRLVVPASLAGRNHQPAGTGGSRLWAT